MHGIVNLKIILSTPQYNRDLHFFSFFSVIRRFSSYGKPFFFFNYKIVLNVILSLTCLKCLKSKLKKVIFFYIKICFKNLNKACNELNAIYILILV